MTGVRLKYLHCFRDRHGKARYYFRYRGQRWALPVPGTEGFATAYDGLLGHIKANPFRSVATIEYMPGSLAWVIEKFLASPLYSNRAESTKRNYRRILDQLRQNYGAGLLADLQPHHVRQIRNELAEKSTSTADIGMGLISTLWNFATEQLGQHKLGADPAYSIKRVHEGKREHEPWPQEVIERFLGAAKPWLRLAVKLALYTGQRRSNLVRMKWSDFDGGTNRSPSAKDRRFNFQRRRHAQKKSKDGHQRRLLGCSSKSSCATSDLTSAYLHCFN